MPNLGGISVSRNVSLILGLDQQSCSAILVVIYVVDCTYNRLGRIEFSHQFSPETKFEDPKYVLVDDDEGYVYVTDKSNVLQFGLDGTLVSIWSLIDFHGRKIVGNPTGITKGINGIIYVADGHNYRVVMKKS